MSWGWEAVPPTLPCLRCKGVGYRMRDGLQKGCKACRGFGKVFCTMRDVRMDYARIREMFKDERGIEPDDFDDIIRRRVEKAKFLTSSLPQGIWFESAFHLAREYDLLEKWWTIQRFGRK